MSFKNYLKNQGQSQSSIDRLLAWQGSFERWTNQVNKSAQELSGSDLAIYLQEEKSQLSKSSLQHELNRIAHYYSYLELENPLCDFKLSSQLSPAHYRYLSESQLISIYQSYMENQRLSLESKILTGL